MANPLDGALNNLNLTISSITKKVEEQSKRVINYKANLIAKLGEIANQLKDLKNSSTLASVPNLKQRIVDLQQQLDNNKNLLQKAQTSLNEATKRTQDLEANIKNLNIQISDKDKKIQDLTNSNVKKDSDIQTLNNEKQSLQKEKTAAENALNVANEQVQTLVKRIEDISGYLGQQVSLIDRIANELGDLQSDNIAEQFNIISSNIEAIKKMIDSDSMVKEGLQQSEYDIEGNVNNLHSLRTNSDKREYGQFINSLEGQIQKLINDNISTFDSGDESAIRQILNNNQIKVPSSKQTFGGKKRSRRIMKKIHRKTHKKMRGGYTYKKSKNLEKASSIISKSSDGSKSISRSMNKSNSKSM